MFSLQVCGLLWLEYCLHKYFLCGVTRGLPVANSWLRMWPQNLSYFSHSYFILECSLHTNLSGLKFCLGLNITSTGFFKFYLVPSQGVTRGQQLVKDVATKSSFAKDWLEESWWGGTICNNLLFIIVIDIFYASWHCFEDMIWIALQRIDSTNPDEGKPTVKKHGILFGKHRNIL